MLQDGWTREASPFHAGERAIQQRIGVRDRLERQGRLRVRTRLPDQHRAFYAGLPWLLVASADDQGRPWCSVLCGVPGFLSSPDPGHLRVAALPSPGDPLARSLASGTRLGLLGLDPATRRRNRLNGRVTALDGAGFLVAVDQAFGNCPQYVQARVWEAEMPTADGTEPAKGLDALDDPAMELISRADTFFVATRAEPAGDDPAAVGLDASHRGGRPGFVRVEADRRTLLIPDFSGNQHFNTLGNLLLDPRAGLLFPDFATGALLLTGEAEIVWDGPQVRAFRGAERLWRFRMDKGVRLPPGTLPLRWALVQPSPNLDATGTWAEADAVVEVW